MYIIKNTHTYTNKKTGKTGSMETYYQNTVWGLVPVLGSIEGAKRFTTRKDATQVLKSLGRKYSIVEHE